MAAGWKDVTVFIFLQDVEWVTDFSVVLIICNSQIFIDALNLITYRVWAYIKKEFFYIVS